MRLHLRISIPGKGERIVVLDAARPVVVGRALDADVSIEDPRVSRQHFRLEFPGPGELRLVEVAARNGTFVGGRRVDRACALSDGAEIVVGQSRLRVWFEAAALPPGPAPVRAPPAPAEPAAALPAEGGAEDEPGADPAADRTRDGPLPPPAPPGPLVVPGYILDRRLHLADYGATRMSVYLALREGTGGEVALKVLEGAAPGSVGLAVFARGARIWSRLRHPRVVAVLEDGSARDLPFVAVEYMARGSLEQLLGALGGGLLVADESLRILVQVAQALEELERCRLVHRAVQPSNILVAADGSLKLSDFFLAKEWPPREDGLTRTGRVKGGSPFYMAPEQLMGSPAGPRADVYALGAVFYQLLTGRAPHADVVEAYADRLGLLGRALAAGPPPALPDLGGFPPGLDQVLARALEPRAERRYPGASALLADLAAIGAC